MSNVGLLRTRNHRSFPKARTSDERIRLYRYEAVISKRFAKFSTTEYGCGYGKKRFEFIARKRTDFRNENARNIF